eukprot:5979675-Pleurochrysis_carterae.AAC.1
MEARQFLAQLLLKILLARFSFFFDQKIGANCVDVGVQPLKKKFKIRFEHVLREHSHRRDIERYSNLRPKFSETTPSRGYEAVLLRSQNRLPTSKLSAETGATTSFESACKFSSLAPPLATLGASDPPPPVSVLLMVTVAPCCSSPPCAPFAAEGSPPATDKMLAGQLAGNAGAAPSILRPVDAPVVKCSRAPVTLPAV